MTSNLTTLTLVFSVLSLLVALYCVWKISSLNSLRKKFFSGTRGIDLESVISILKQELNDSQDRQTNLETALKQLRHDFTFAVQKVGLVRFNPFDDGGGNFSFSLVLLDEHNSGVVITSMHGRQQNRIYSKKINDGLCDIKLTEEEQAAVNMANDK